MSDTPRVKSIEVVRPENAQNIRYEFQMTDGWIHSAGAPFASEAIVKCVNHILEFYLIKPFPTGSVRIGKSERIRQREK